MDRVQESRGGNMREMQWMSVKSWNCWLSCLPFLFFFDAVRIVARPLQSLLATSASSVLLRANPFLLRVAAVTRSLCVCVCARVCVRACVCVFEHFQIFKPSALPRTSWNRQECVLTRGYSLLPGTLHAETRMNLFQTIGDKTKRSQLTH